MALRTVIWAAVHWENTVDGVITARRPRLRDPAGYRFQSWAERSDLQAQRGRDDCAGRRQRAGL